MSNSKGYALTDGVGSSGQVLTSQGPGQPATWSGSLSNNSYGSFLTTTAETIIPNTVVQLPIDDNSAPTGVRATGNNMVFDVSGTYSITASFQLTNENVTGEKTVTIWIKLNGTVVDNSSSVVTVHRKPGSSPWGSILLTVNYVLDLASSQTIGFYAISNDSGDVKLRTVAPDVSGGDTIPASPAAIITAVKVK